MTSNFKAILIKPFSIDKYDWAQCDYIDDLLNNEGCSEINIPYDNNTMLGNIGNLLEISNFNNPLVQTHSLDVTPEYIYEIIYMKYKTEEEDIEKMSPNNFATLIDLQGEDIVNNAILLKLHLPKDQSKKTYVDLTKKDIVELMRGRLHTSVVVYEDDEFREEIIPGPIDKFAEIFFEDDNSRIKQEELGFLKHNLNIWYLADEYGEPNVCGKLIDNKLKIFKCFIFTKITEDRRGHLTLDEVNKIIYLSNQLEDFKTPTKYLKDFELDDMNLERLENEEPIDENKIMNKYVILNEIYNKIYNEYKK